MSISFIFMELQPKMRISGTLDLSNPIIIDYY
jgi:hypothetical protein